MASRCISRLWTILIFRIGGKLPCFVTVLGPRDREYITLLGKRRLMRNPQQVSIVNSRVADHLLLWFNCLYKAGSAPGLPAGATHPSGSLCLQGPLYSGAGSLRARVLSMAHEGHLGIVKLKQGCRNLVWWLGIDHDNEGLVRDCEPCLLSGKTGLPASTLVQPFPWPSHPWDQLQLDICGEIHDHRVPHHQRFLVVMYNLHSKWPEVIPAGTVTSQTITQILESLFALGNGSQFTSADFSTFLCNKGIKHIWAALYHPKRMVGLKGSLRALRMASMHNLSRGTHSKQHSI